MVTLIKSLHKPKDKLLAERVVDIINPHFNFDVSDRITVKSDMNQFNPDTNLTVWKQGKGEIPHYHEIYWDDVWMCDFHEKMNGAQVLHDFLVGFTNAYKDDQIRIHKKTEFEKGMEIKQAKNWEDSLNKKIKEFGTKRAATPEEYLSNIAIKEVLEDKKKEKSIKSKKLEKNHAKR